MAPLLVRALLAPPARPAAPGEIVRRAVRSAAEQHVVEHREPRQRLRELERTDHPGPGDPYAGMPRGCVPVEGPAAAVRVVEAGEQVEQGRLARAVRTDERGDRVALDLEVLDVDREQPAEGPARRRRPSRIGSGFATPGSVAMATSAGIGCRSSLSPAGPRPEDHQQHQRDANEDVPDQLPPP